MSSKEEAIAAGALHTTKHSMKRRSIYHNYYATGTYMITLVTQGRQQLFGHLSGNPLLPLFTEGSAKGRMVLVEGTLGNPTIWLDKSGEEHVQLYINADSIQFVSAGRKKDGQTVDEQAENSVTMESKQEVPAAPKDSEKDLPF